MIIAGSIVGSGELIATTKVGAEAGFALLWLIIVGCVIKVFAQVELGRYTVTWAETPLQALNSVPGPRARVNWLIWYWAAMTLLIVTQQGGILGGVGQALAIGVPLTAAGAEYNQAYEALTRARVEVALAGDAGGANLAALQSRAEALATSAAAVAEPMDAYIWAVTVAILTALLLYVGRYGLIQAVSTVLVIGFTAVTVITVIMLQRTPFAMTGAEIGSGLSFKLPPYRAGVDPLATALAAFGIIGLGASELIMYPYWCLEKGYARQTGPRDGSAAWNARARGWMRVMYTDAWLSMIVYTFATVAFYLLGAAVLWQIGLNPEGSTMIRTLSEMYVPVFGAWAQPFFLFGAIAVLYSTFFVAAAGNARMVADGLGLFGLHEGTEASRTRWTRMASVLWPLVALCVLLFVRAPVAMVLASGVAQAVMLPMLGIAVLYFRYRRSDPGLAPGKLWDAMLWLSCIGFFVVGGWAAYNAFAR
ncbi:MAG: transmembrane Mn(2+) transporter [Gemmatimonadetes bacterium]|nr:transmembrane Mn(2+) transporter [Gemmatimonadota bacterium]